ncbi:hypothetical protein EHO57_14150 [Leptospira langatensis]|uniref:Uncharacterized protein n=1 Tax=Leptospira langatensis TaxID=2484983 RepID=A0A5R2AT39_9LEPT|nr:hypothetical protein [Leptospira langatensis]TGJ99896.1 hypothetical protein EHO57_14150 [Leptospira langatensis]
MVSKRITEKVKEAATPESKTASKYSSKLFRRDNRLEMAIQGIFALTDAGISINAELLRHIVRDHYKYFVQFEDSITLTIEGYRRYALEIESLLNDKKEPLAAWERDDWEVELREIREWLSLLRKAERKKNARNSRQGNVNEPEG